ncbi:MAG: UvrB/UvrC motif-containing protein [Candidatus Tectomicrobia bacterium]|uniref:UvrB/UvrC motif-containing protein n=1 Tax=Tectimicrobiota bacterium TaxID=2528274 RepID=A0A932CM44_UNCTE|nr:UvrB/UvrC motif-containing protein [Candidatus Tectomicrobia bacterium]
MSKDLNEIIEGWDYDPDDFASNVRRIQGGDGRSRLQLRTDLGIYQLELEGRPDGKRPGGQKSMLDYYLFKAQEHENKYDAVEGRFKLTEGDIAKLYREAIQFYHRRICFFALKDFEGARRDAEHTLGIMDIVKRYANSRIAVMHFEQYRPYLIGEKTRAIGLACLERKDYPGTLQVIGEGVNEIMDFYRDYGHEELIDKCQQIQFLRGWQEQLRRDWENDTGDLPISGLTLEEQLKIAIQQEDYEEAVRLRDRIREQKGNKMRPDNL